MEINRILLILLNELNNETLRLQERFENLINDKTSDIVYKTNNLSDILGQMTLNDSKILKLTTMTTKHTENA